MTDKDGGAMEEEIKVAVEWWARKLAGPVIHDNGDAGQSVMASVFSFSIPRLTDQQIADFKSNLTEGLKGHLFNAIGSYGRAVGVDYHPDPVLAKAANAAGIGQHMLRFPCKTMMWIDPGEVKVAEGHGAPAKFIYSAPRPQPKSQQDTGMRTPETREGKHEKE